MIVDLAHVPNLTQRRADAPLNPLSESPPPDDDAVRLSMDDSPPLPNYQRAVGTDDEPQRSADESAEPGAADGEAAGGEGGETEDQPADADSSPSSRPKSTAAAASHNLPKLIIPEPGDTDARKRR